MCVLHVWGLGSIIWGPSPIETHLSQLNAVRASTLQTICIMYWEQGLLWKLTHFNWCQYRKIAKTNFIFVEICQIFANFVANCVSLLSQSFSQRFVLYHLTFPKPLCFKFPNILVNFSFFSFLIIPALKQRWKTFSEIVQKY